MLCSGDLLWPSPTGLVSVGTSAVPVRSDFFEIEIEFAPSVSVRQHLHDAFQLFKQDLRQVEGRLRSVRTSHDVVVRVSVNDSGDPSLRLHTDESYQLSVEPIGSVKLLAEIMAASFCGARHGLETLSQLIWLDPYLGSLLILQEAEIRDKPKFGYRGLMIDTARNHIPFSDILRTIDVMAASKLNTLHWHASDSQAFSIQFDNVPVLTPYGANNIWDVYTTDQVKALVYRARLRGIRVIIEIDSPAHVVQALNWGPEDRGDVVLCVDSDCENPPCGQLNPYNSYVFEILQNIYADIIELTGVDDIFHLGGDDISLNCLAEHFNGSAPISIWTEFTRTLIHRLEYVNGKLPNLTVFWSSLLSGQITSDLKDLKHLIGLQVRSSSWTEKIVNGLRKIVSHEDAWDLNSGLGNWHATVGKTQFNSWQRFYEHRPWIKAGSGIIIGGEATLWSWTVSEGGFDTRVWLRAAALAERLWSDRPEGVTPKVCGRLDVHRTRLAERDLRIAPIWSNWCTQNPYTCS